jgi:hypothetical protein
MAGGEFVGGTVGRYLNSPIDVGTETTFEAHALSTTAELACLSRPPCEDCLRVRHQRLRRFDDALDALLWVPSKIENGVSWPLLVID